MSNRKGLFLVLSAPSGAGKTTLTQRLLRDEKELAPSLSCTTRPPRPGEKEGVDYHFIDEKTFRGMADRGEFFEWEEVHGSFYGTPKGPLLQRREKGLDTVLDIDTRGALNVKKAYPDSCLIFVMPPSVETLEQRLKARRTEGEATLKRRLENALREMAEKDKFDYIIINDDIDRAYRELRKIIDKVRGHSGGGPPV